MTPHAGEAGDGGFTGRERVALDLHVDEPLGDDADRGAPEQHQAHLRCDVRPENELARGEAHAGGDHTRTNERPEALGRFGKIPNLLLRNDIGHPGAPSCCYRSELNATASPGSHEREAYDIAACNVE